MKKNPIPKFDVKFADAPSGLDHRNGTIARNLLRALDVTLSSVLEDPKNKLSLQLSDELRKLRTNKRSYWTVSSCDAVVLPNYA